MICALVLLVLDVSHFVVCLQDHFQFQGCLDVEIDVEVLRAQTCASMPASYITRTRQEMR